jgi:tetratricopeptide (TPR) repeat protein
MKLGIPGQKPATPEDFQRVYGDCLKNFQWARDYFPDDWEFYFNVGNALYNLGRKSESVVEYKKASELNPLGVDVFFNWSVATFELKDYYEASKLFQKVLDLDPNRQGAKDGLDYLKKIGFLSAPDPTKD